MAFTSVRPCPTLAGHRQAFAPRHVSTASLGYPTRVVCRSHNQEQQAASASSQLISGMAVAASAALLLLSPLDAHAVSGGGGISTPLEGADLSGQDLRKKSYTKAVLRKANFAGSDLTGVSFFSSLAEGANFTGANLTLADLESGNFEDADFTNAVLAGAFVNNAQLKGAKITGSDWSEVVLRKDMQKFLCNIADGTNPTTGVETRESLLCP